MNLRSVLLLFLALGAASGAAADVTSGDLPGNTIWYLHADIKQMRDSESGAPIFDWFDADIMEEINDELGVQLSDEIDSVTAFSDENLGTVMVVDGRISSEMRDELMGRLRDEVEVRDLSYDGKRYHFAGDEEGDRRPGRDPFDDFDDALYFSFDVRNKLIVTSHEDQMKALLDSGGRLTGSGSVENTMFVLTADKSFVQAGLRPGGMAQDDDDDWESNIIRNTEQASLLISDSAGNIALEAQLRSTDPKMAQSIGGIVNGLISLQMFNSELDPEMKSLIQNTRVSVADNLLSISTVIDPALAISIFVD